MNAEKGKLSERAMRKATGLSPYGWIWRQGCLGQNLNNAFPIAISSEPDLFHGSAGLTFNMEESNDFRSQQRRIGDKRN